MFNVPIDIVSLILSAGAAYLLGGLWFSNMLFGPRVAELSGVSSETAKGSLSSYVGNAVVLLVQAYVMTIVLFYFEASGYLDGLTVGLVMWLGFLATSSAGSILWERKPAGLYIIKNGYMLLASLIMGAIISGRIG